MKKSTFTLFLLISFLSISLSAQQTVWLNKKLHKTTQDQAVYYKIGNKLEGEVTYFYKSRTIYRKVFFVEGKMEGNFYEYYNSGELREVGKCKNGLREGNWKEYYRNGKIRKKGGYRNGKKVGVWKVFYKND